MSRDGGQSKSEEVNVKDEGNEGNTTREFTRKKSLWGKRLFTFICCMSISLVIMIGIGYVAVLFVSCPDEEMFTEFPGFDDFFQRYPPSNQTPTEYEKALLWQYRPRIYMSKYQKEHAPFIDFYEDYIRSGSLYVSGRKVSDDVDQELLNHHARDRTAEFIHNSAGRNAATKPVVLGRVDRDNLTHGGKLYEVLFLSYNLVFSHSGLIRGLSPWQSIAMDAIGDTDDWHQLDHYVGMTMALYQGKPLALMIQQHNDQTTLLITDDGSGLVKSTYTTRPSRLVLEGDNRTKVDVALRSNELYIHASDGKETRHPAVSFLQPSNIEFYLTGKNKPVMAGYDVTDGTAEQNYDLRFLPPSDAFYTFRARLGQRRCFPGRDGPPGSAYVTLPSLLPYATRMVAGYRPGSIEQERKKLEDLQSAKFPSVNLDALDAYRSDFFRDSGLN